MAAARTPTATTASSNLSVPDKSILIALFVNTASIQNFASRSKKYLTAFFIILFSLLVFTCDETHFFMTFDRNVLTCFYQVLLLHPLFSHLFLDWKGYIPKTNKRHFHIKGSGTWYKGSGTRCSVHWIVMASCADLPAQDAGVGHCASFPTYGSYEMIVSLLKISQVFCLTWVVYEWCHTFELFTASCADIPARNSGTSLVTRMHASFQTHQSIISHTYGSICLCYLPCTKFGTESCHTHEMSMSPA